MLPFCDRTVNVPRNDVAPVWSHSFPISKEPTSLGQHLRKKRFDMGMRQTQAADILNVSNRTLSLWETDRIYPAWAFQPRIIAYLGHDPFTNPALGMPKGNETQSVAILAPEAPATIGQKIQQQRLKMRKNRKECAKELGVSVKTLRSWETNSRQPSKQLRQKLINFLEIAPLEFGL